jgi:hypothetical protein
MNGLSVDFKTVSYHFTPSMYSSLCSPLYQHPLESSSTGLFHDPSLPPLHIPCFLPRVEQPSISKMSLELLNKVLQRHDDVDQTPAALSCLGPLIRSRSKFSQPLLRTDHEYDCRVLERYLAERTQSFANIGNLPLEPLELSKDEGLVFPPAAHRFQTQLETSSRNERLELPRETLVFLTGQLGRSDKEVNHEQTLLDEKKISSRRASYFRKN